MNCYMCKEEVTVMEAMKINISGTSKFDWLICLGCEKELLRYIERCRKGTMEITHSVNVKVERKSK